MDDVHHKHDKGYKHLLSSKRVFVEMLRSFVHEDWVGQVDEQHLVRIDKSFVLQDFSEQESDLVYRMKFKDHDVIFYVLLELQSFVDFQMPYRLLLYMVEIWRSLLKDVTKKEAEQKSFRLPAVVPIVLYNGSTNWTASRTFKETLSGHEQFGDYVIDFKYLLIDVKRYLKEDLLNLKNVIGSAFLLDQKTSLSELMNRFEETMDIFRQIGPEDFPLFRSWAMNIIARALPEQSKEQAVRIIQESEEAEMMVYNMELTLREEFERRHQAGLEKGKAESKLTIANKLLATGMDVPTVAAITELDEEEVAKLLHSDH